MKILILGCGQLGLYLHDYLKQKHDDWIINILTIRIDDYSFMGGKTYLRSDNDVVINTIAVSNTRTCEANWSETAKVNAAFPIKLAMNRFCASYRYHYSCENLPKDLPHLVHISTGCIFDGNTFPISEEANPTPLINYARQKHIAEICADIYPKTTILRPRMIFSDRALASNLIYKVNGFSRLLDEPNSMTSAIDLCEVIDKVIEQKAYGTYNVCNEGLSSPYRVKQLIAEIWNKDQTIEKISKDELLEEMNGLQLTNTWIDSTKISSLYKMPPVEDRLREMIQKSEWLA